MLCTTIESNCFTKNSLTLFHISLDVCIVHPKIFLKKLKKMKRQFVCLAFTQDAKYNCIRADIFMSLGF